MNEDEYKPTANPWVTTATEYQGQGQAELPEIDGQIEGPTVVRYDAFGSATVEMQVASARRGEQEEVEPLTVAMREKPGSTTGSSQFDLFDNNLCSRLVVTTPEGIFTTTQIVTISPSIGFTVGAPIRLSLRFHLGGSRFDVAVAERPVYWVVPLLNFLSDFQQHDPDLDRHPLRIYPTPIVPEGLVDQEHTIASYAANSRNRLIIFEFSDSLGFIEAVPEYEQQKEALRTGNARQAVTAVMVANLGNETIDYPDLDAWFPYDFLPLLSLATGTEVALPWIEFRDASGGLVRRIHGSTSRSPFVSGHAIIDELTHRGTGRLLTKAQQSPHFKASFLRVATKHIVRGMSSGMFIENNLLHLLQACECLCKHYNLTTQNLIASLDATQQDEIRTVLSNAAQQIRIMGQVAHSAGRRDQVQALNRIAERTMSTPTQTDRAFGSAVVELLQQFGMPDAAIVDDHYKAHPRPDGRQTWAAVLGLYRGDVVHKGYIDFGASGASISDVHRIRQHLHDVLVRIVLTLLGYDATYQPTVAKMAGTMLQIDWVKPNTPPAELGY